MTYQLRRKERPARATAGFGRMLVLSAALHAGAIVGLVTAGVSSLARPMPPAAYRVSLVAPSALVPSRGGRPASAPVPPSRPQDLSSELPPAQTMTKLQAPQPAAKKPAQPVPEKERVKLPDTRPKPRKKVASKKPKKTPHQPKQRTKKLLKKQVAKTARSPKKPAAKAAKPRPAISAQERDARHLAEALKRVRQNVKPARRPSPQASGSGAGGGNGSRAMSFVMYTAQVQQRVRDSWIVTRKQAGLTAVVQFGIRPNGEIIEIQLARSSGNVAFDQSALRAVHYANPLPPPPLDHMRAFLSQKVTVAFGE